MTAWLILMLWLNELNNCRYILPQTALSFSKLP